MPAKRSQRQRSSIFVLTLCLLLAGGSAYAKTWSVEVWGNDAAGCGSKSNPCQNIQHVIGSLATKNDKIVVGPGIYEENLVVDTGFGSAPLEGLKLESTAGRFATFIKAFNTASAVVTISQPKVRIGKRGKGFTLEGASDSGIRLTTGDTSNIRIEGNLFRDLTWGVFGSSTSKLQVRHNHFKGGGAVAIYCSNCGDALVQDNLLDGVGTYGIQFFNAEDSTVKFTIQRNRVFTTTNPLNGINLNGPNITNARLKDNVVLGDAGASGGNGFELNAPRVSLVQGNISSYAGGRGFSIQQTDFISGSKTQSNLAVGNAQVGFYLGTMFEGRFDKNTAVQNGETANSNLAEASGIYLSAPDQSFTSFARNNSWGHPDDTVAGCGISVEFPGFEYSKHFFGGTGGTDPTPGDGDAHDNHCVSNIGNVPSGTTVDKPNPISVRAAAKL